MEIGCSSHNVSISVRKEMRKTNNEDVPNSDNDIGDNKDIRRKDVIQESICIQLIPSGHTGKHLYPSNTLGTFINRQTLPTAKDDGNDMRDEGINRR